MNLRIGLAAALTLALAACAQTPKAPTAHVSPTITPPTQVLAAAPALEHVFTPTPGLSTRDRQRKAIDLLNRGEVGQARAEIDALLLAQPTHAAARKLRDQLDRDPKVLLGEKSYAYKVRRGETMSTIAGRLLGDPLMFYALARYNDIASPAEMEVGQTLQIPGTPKKAAPVPAQVKTAQRNPARAGQLRGQALEHMNRGSINQAVGLLRQALLDDPGNSVIQRDLDRAVRIQTTVAR